MSPLSCRPTSAIFTPLNIANGNITLKHRIIMSPMTRNRGMPLNPRRTPQYQNKVWVADELMALYYAQRATDGGLIITESILPCEGSGGMPGVTGLWLPEHVKGWKIVTEAVHEKGGIIYAQINHHGRVAIPQFNGQPTVSASATPFSTEEKYPFPPPLIPAGTPYHESLVSYKSHPPRALSIPEIEEVLESYTLAARNAIKAGFDGIEIHGGNGYLVDQFLNSNVNTREDVYGGCPENRCRFLLQLIERIGERIGMEKVAVRLSPFGVYNDMKDDDRLSTYTYLCETIKERCAKISYVHFIEPRQDEIQTNQEHFESSWGKRKNIDLTFAKEILGSIPILSAGGWNADTCWGVVERQETVDACVFARWFVSNPDLVCRLREGRDLTMYNRSKFYGPSSKREVGYTDYLTWEEQQRKRIYATT